MKVKDGAEGLPGQVPGGKQHQQEELLSAPQQARHSGEACQW